MAAEYLNTENFPAFSTESVYGISICGTGMRRLAEQHTPDGGCPRNQRPLVAENSRLLYLRGDADSHSGSGKDVIIRLLARGESYSPIYPARAREVYWIDLQGALADHIAVAFAYIDGTAVTDRLVDRKLTELFSNIVLAARRGADDNRHELIGMTMHIIGLMESHARGYGHSDDVVVCAKKLMHSRLQENLTSGEVASILGVGYDTFRRSFKKNTGLSPARYMENLKIAEAKKMLSDSTRSIKEISYTLSYESPCYFSRAFKRREGISPLEYRFLRCCKT